MKTINNELERIKVATSLSRKTEISEEVKFKEAIKIINRRADEAVQVSLLNS